MSRRWAWGLLPALVCACGVDLSYPVGSRVVCLSDADCSGNTKCSQTAGVCIAADDPDELPRIASATATDSTHVVLLFSTTMERESLGRLATYTLAPDIGVVAVAAAEDGTRVVLSTTAQRGRPYLVTATGLTDTLGRPLADEEVQFDGIGTPVNTTPPGPVFPPSETRLLDAAVRFAWTENVDAATYTLEVARDTAFTDMVIRETQVAATFDATLPGDDTYFWRVRSDVSEPSAVFVFAIVATGLHVHCPVGQNCVDDLASFRGGDPKHPLRDPTFAAAVASTLGSTTIRIARRGDASLPAYPASLIVLTTPLIIEGAYDATFAQRDLAAPTAFSAEGSIARIANTIGTVISGVQLQGNSGVTEPVFDIVASSGLVLDHVTIIVGNSQAMALRVAESDVQLTRVTVDGVGHAQSSFVNSTISADDTRFVAHPFFANASDITLVGCDITVTPDVDADEVPGVTSLASTLRLVRTAVTMPVQGKLIGALVDVTEGTLVASASRIIVGEQGCAGCAVASAVRTSEASAVLVDSLVVAGNIVAAALQCTHSGPLDLAVMNSTVVNLSDHEALVLTTTGNTRTIDVVNSVFVGSASAPCISGSPPATLRNVAFVGCSELLNEYSDVDALNGQSSSSGGHIADNIATTAALDTLFPRRAGTDMFVNTADDDYAPTRGGPFDASGGANVVCGGSDVSRPCPVSLSDIVGVSRGSPPAIGAWEAR